MYDYAGKIAIVTGAAHGIGQKIAARLLAEGCRLALWDVDAAGLSRAVAKSGADEARASQHIVDVTQLAQVRAGVEDVLRQHGRIDFLINNAGGGMPASIIEETPERFESNMNLNVFGVFNCCHAVVPSMVARKEGQIINISSWNGKKGARNMFTYSATKFAVLGMTQSMALDLAGHGIRVNAVCPGIIMNTRLREIGEKHAIATGAPTAADRIHQVPLGRLGEPEDVANVVAFLLSNQASYMTGQGINVTGGMWMN